MKKITAAVIAISALSVLIITAGPGGGGHSSVGRSSSGSMSSSRTGSSSRTTGIRTGGTRTSSFTGTGTKSSGTYVNKYSGTKTSSKSGSHVAGKSKGVAGKGSHSWASKHGIKGKGWKNAHGFGWNNNNFNIGFWNGAWGLWWAGAWLPWNTWCSTYGPNWGWGWNDCWNYLETGYIPVYVIERIQQEVEMPEEDYSDEYVE